MRVFSALLILVLAGCSDSSDRRPAELSVPAEPEFLPIAAAEVTSPPEVGAPLDFGILDLSQVGYQQREFFIGGTASAFRNLSELSGDGLWEVEAAEQAQYLTRVLVRRPVDADDFNGTVLVEWMNVSSGFDTTPQWDHAHVQMLREGYAWVGVTAQFVGVYGSSGGIVPFHLKGVDPIRYDSVVHPGDSFSYDIFSQLAQTLRQPESGDLLEGLEPGYLIGGGYSQSAFFLTTYINAIHPLYNPYDGYLISSRGNFASPLALEPQTPIPISGDIFIRTDLNVPVLQLQSETDVLRSSLNSVRVRQGDSPVMRFWEVAGTSHTDRYSSGVGWTDDGNDPSAAAVAELDNIQGFIQCDSPINSGPMHYVFNAALEALNLWMVDGLEPPSGPLLELSDDMSELVLDELGNARGGIRTPHLDAPVAVLSGFGQSGESFCGLFGTTELFSADQLVSLYTDEAGYVAAVTEAAESAVEKRFLLPLDAEQIITWAPQQWRMQTQP